MSVERALAYLDHDRFAEAQRELLEVLRDDPDDAYATALFSIVCTGMDKYADAVEAAQAAISLDPDSSLGHHALAYAYLHMDRPAQGLEPVKEAIRLSPENPTHHLLLGALQLSRQKWNEALEASSQALELDPESADALNQKSVALQMLGRKAEAIEASLQSLNHEPDSPNGLASHGLALLRAGKNREAEEAFRDALRQDPESDFAREGLLQSLRVRFLPYRAVFAFHSWQDRFPTGVRWGMWLGIYALAQASRALAQSAPRLAPFLMVVAGLYTLFVALTWCSLVLANSTLLFHPLGRLALSRVERVEAGIAGTAFLAGILGGILLLARNTDGGALAAGGALAVVITGLGSHITTPTLRWIFSVGIGGLILFLGLGAFIALLVR